MDNRHYVNGVRDKGQYVMPALSSDDKEFLNQFNKEYYNASFSPKDEDKRLHVSEIDNDTVQDIKGQIKAIKKLRKKIFDKSSNTTTEKDREEARMYSQQIEEMEEFLERTHPRKKCYDANNQRNRCFTNKNRASNEVRIVSMESINTDVTFTDSIANMGAYINEDED